MIEYLFLDLDDTILDFKMAEYYAIRNTLADFGLEPTEEVCARYSVISNVLDVSVMYFLLPKYGIDGYFFSFALTHAVNFALSLRKVLSISGVQPSRRFLLLAPFCAAFAVFGGRCFTGPIRRSAAFLGLFFSLCFYLGLLDRSDIRWLKGLISGSAKQPKTADATNS